MKHPLVLVAGIVIAAFVIWRRRRLEPTLLAGGSLVALGCLLVGVGVVPLPNVEAIIEEVGATLGTWTYLFVGVFAFLETGAFVGLLAPGETVVVVGGVVAGQGRIDLLTLIAITWGAATAGDVCSFYLGRRLGRGFLERHGPKVAITEERLAHVERFFDRYGGMTILVGRFLGLVRALAPFLAGASRMPLRRFLPYDVIAAGIWATTFCVLGYVFWRSLDQVTRWAGTGAFALGTIVAIVVATVFLHRLATDTAYRGRVREWVQRQPGGSRFLALVSPVMARAFGPARFVWHRVTPGELGLELTTLVALAGVGTFVFVLLGGDVPLGFDSRAFDVVDTFESGALAEAVTIFTDLGSFPVVSACVFATVLWALLRGRGLDALALLAGFVVLVWLVGEAKAGFDRPRPEESLVATRNQSYPSGHAAYGAVLVGCAVVLVRGGAPWALRFAAVTVAAIAAAAVAVSRVYLHAHYLSDTLGGLGLGFAVLSLSAILALLFAHLRDNGSAPG